MTSFNNILYLGGLPHPYSVGKISVTVDQKNHCIAFHQPGHQNITIPKSYIMDVRTSVIKSRSLGKAIAGYCLGNLINKQYGGLIGAALGAKRKDESELFIDYAKSNQIRTIFLKPGKKVWDLYAAVYSLII